MTRSTLDTGITRTLPDDAAAGPLPDFELSLVEERLRRHPRDGHTDCVVIGCKKPRGHKGAHE